MNPNEPENTRTAASCAAKMLFVSALFMLIALAVSVHAGALQISGTDMAEGRYYTSGTSGGLTGSDSEGWTVLLLGDTLYLKGADINDILLENGENITIRLLADSKIGSGKGSAIDYSDRSAETAHITLECGEHTLSVNGDCSAALTVKSGTAEITGTLYCLSARSGRHGDIIIDGGSLAVEGAVELGLTPTDGSYPGNIILLCGALEATDGLSREPIIIPRFIYQTEPGGDYTAEGYRFTTGEYISIIAADFAEPIRDEESAGDDLAQGESEPDTRSSADAPQSTAGNGSSAAAESSAPQEGRESHTSGIAVAALIIASAALALGIVLAAAGIKRKKAAQKHDK